jgi:hypothetical protein
MTRALIALSFAALTPAAATSQSLLTYQNAVAFLPDGVAEFKAAIVFLPGLRDPSTGNPLDSRGLVRGTSDAACSIWCGGDKDEVRKRALELVGGKVALIGTTTLLDDGMSRAALLEALTEFSRQSKHPELANIPIFFVGHSMGGCAAYGFTRENGARVAGFMTMKGGCHNPGPSQDASSVPGYFLIGDADAPHRRENITAVYEAGRAAGAPWTLQIDPYGHSPMLDFGKMFDWIGDVLAARLPVNAGEPLRAMKPKELTK